MGPVMGPCRAVLPTTSITMQRPFAAALGVDSPVAPLASRPGVATLPAQQLRENASAAVSLLLQMQTWATAPMSSVECREELQAALKKLTPQCEANRTKFADVMATAQQLQAILCGSGENPRKG